jgi:hypothetical protein
MFQKGGAGAEAHGLLAREPWEHACPRETNCIRRDDLPSAALKPKEKAAP